MLLNVHRCCVPAVRVLAVRVLAVLVLAAFVLAVMGGPASVAAETPIADFSFLQFSDVHVSPVPAEGDATGAVRGQGTIDWLCTQSGKPQALPCFDLTAPPPAFALATGDLTEYGVMGRTWPAFEHAFAKLSCPLYVLPGNHDNTWVAMYPQMRRLHGGENYAFDHGGCHFVCLSSASPQEPVPTLDGKTRAWLDADLAKVAPGTPVFVALHHPPDSGEFAQPAEFDTLVDRLRDHNVALILYGHGHSVVHKSFGGMDGIMGGSTFGKRAGYALADIRDGRLRVAYCYDPEASAKKGKGGQPEVVPLVDKPLAVARPERLCRIVEPEKGASVAGDTLSVALTLGSGVGADGVELRIDGEAVEVKRVEGSSPARLRVEAPIAGLTPGAHLLTAEVAAGGVSDLRTCTFHVERPEVEVLWRRAFPAAFKAGPVMAGRRLVLAGNDGMVTAVDPRTGETAWQFATGAEILGTPAYAGQTLVVGSGDGKVYGLSHTGQKRWAQAVGAPVYGGVLIQDGVAYVGDNGGRLHALAISDGSPRWTFSQADFSIESQPTAWRDAVVFGAWDGYLYAVNKADGSLKWKTPGPKSSEGKAARYYAPADCGPIVVDRALWVCDRGYELGAYDHAGQMQSKQAAKAAGIAPTADGRSFFVRTTDDRVLRVDGSGKTIWARSAPAGRFPIPPTEHDGRLYVCSNAGLLSVVDAQTGKSLGRYQVTPGLYVMAPVAVGAGDDADGAPVCYVAGMDGTVSAVRFR